MTPDPTAPADQVLDLPLAGIRVLDLTRALAGPFCTALLGDLGADVVKVEGLPNGDSTRGWPPHDGDVSLYYASTNRNKRSIAMDLRTSDAKMVLRDLAAGADILVENFRHGVLAKLGLDPASLRREHPDLIISSVTGFGNVGPMRDHAGFDQIAQGMSGMMTVTGFAQTGPTRMGIPIVDLATGMFSTIGILAGLAGRERGTRPARVSTSLLESATSLMVFQAQRYLSLGEVPQQQGNDHPVVTPYGVFEAKDGPINVAAGREPMWGALCDIVERPEWATRDEYANGVLRTRNRTRLTAELNDRFRTRNSAEWFELMHERGIPCGPIYRMDEVFAEPQVEALNMVQHVADESASMPLMRGPLSLDSHPTPIRALPPRLGQHTREILIELGYSQERMASMVQRGVIRDARDFEDPARPASAAAPEESTR